MYGTNIVYMVYIYGIYMVIERHLAGRGRVGSEVGHHRGRIRIVAAHLFRGWIRL